MVSKLGSPGLRCTRCKRKKPFSCFGKKSCGDYKKICRDCEARKITLGSDFKRRKRGKKR